MSERMQEYNTWDFSDRTDVELPLSERVANTYDYLGIVGANWHPGEVAQLEAENDKLTFACKQALMAIEDGYFVPKITDDLRDALKEGK